MCKLKSKEKDILMKINKTVIHDDSLDSFENQLLSLVDGMYDTKYPMIISKNSKCLSYISLINVEKPLTINVSTVIKIKEKHATGYAYLANTEKLLQDSVLAFESLTQKTSVVILLDDERNKRRISICRYDKKSGEINVNEITSVYDKDSLANMMVTSWDENKTFFKNKKTERFIQSARLQLPLDLKFALSNNYNNKGVCKNQFFKSITNKSKYDISLLGLQKRYENILKKNNIISIQQLCAYTEEMLLGISGIGKCCVNNVIDSLLYFGLYLKAEKSND